MIAMIKCAASAGKRGRFFSPPRFRPGLTLVELVLVMIVSAIGMAGIGTLGEVFFRNWRESRHIVMLQEDLDLASYLVKGVMEEADEWEVGNDWAEVSTDDWTYRFERQGGSLLVTGPGGPEAYVNNLEQLDFHWDENERAEWVRVVIRLGQSNRSLRNEFLVVKRNEPPENQEENQEDNGNQEDD